MAEASPATAEQFRGPSDPLLSPSDSVGAAGPTRYVVMVNEMYAIYDKTVALQRLLSTGPLATFTPVESDLFGLFDPQIIWDADTERFYYALDDIICGTFLPCQGAEFRSGIAWGFSKTAEPDSPLDWCHYLTDFGVYGREFPDYPKLGDTKEFLLVGVNVYDFLEEETPYLGSDVGWISKPPAGEDCPPDTALRTGVVRKIENADGTDAFTPVPANQIDGESTGYVVAGVDLGEPGSPEEEGRSGSPAAADKEKKPKPVKSGNFLTQFTVSRNKDGTAHIPKVGRRIAVPVYKPPPAAPQRGSLALLDTLDGRLTNAQEAVDPRARAQFLYTQHTIAGGAGSMVRWYRIDPRRGTAVAYNVSHPRLYVYNGAVSTDRVRRGSTKAFGDAVVVGVTTSSATTRTVIRMAAKVGGGPISPLIFVRGSSGPNEDFTCFGDNGEPAVCRWGDYSAATPDPAASTAAAHGIVWMTNMWTGIGEPISGSYYWRTWSWAARL
jgi:hypothetical protein